MSRRLGSADFSRINTPGRGRVERTLVGVFKIPEDEFEDFVEEHDEAYPGAAEDGRFNGWFLERYIETYWDIAPEDYWGNHRAEKGRKSHFSAYGSNRDIQNLQRDLTSHLQSIQQIIDQLAA